MSSIAKLFREFNLTFSPFAFDELNKTNIIDDMKREIGNEHGGEFKSVFVLLLWIDLTCKINSDFV